MHNLLSVSVTTDSIIVCNTVCFKIKVRPGSKVYTFWGDGTMSTVVPCDDGLSAVIHVYPEGITADYHIEMWSDTHDTLLEFESRSDWNVKKVEFCCCPVLRRLYFSMLPADTKFDFPCLEEMCLDSPEGETLVISGVPALQKLYCHGLADSNIQVLDIRENNMIEEMDLYLRNLRKIWISSDSHLRSLKMNKNDLDKKSKAMITRIINRNNHTDNPEVIQYPDVMSLNEHIRRRPYMYVGGMSHDGLYVLVADIVKNAAYEYKCGFGNEINVSVRERVVTVQDNGRGFPMSEFKRLIETVPQNNDKNDTWNCGFGIKTVNALSSELIIESVRGGVSRRIVTSRGNMVSDDERTASGEPSGTTVTFVADTEIFGEYEYDMEIITDIIKWISASNTGLTFSLNGEEICYKHGFADFIREKCDRSLSHAILHCVTDECEFAIAPCGQDKDQVVLSIINDDNRNEGGYHIDMLAKAFKDILTDYCKINEMPTSSLNCIMIAINLSVDLPMYDRGSRTRNLVGRNGYGSQSVSGSEYKEELYNYFYELIQLKFSQMAESLPDIISPYVLES